MEIDLIIHAHGKYSCVEIKSKTSPDTHDAKWLNKAEDLLPDLAENTSIVCMTEKAFPISPSIVAHSIWQIWPLFSSWQSYILDNTQHAYVILFNIDMKYYWISMSKTESDLMRLIQVFNKNVRILRRKIWILARARTVFSPVRTLEKSCRSLINRKDVITVFSLVRTVSI